MRTKCGRTQDNPAGLHLVGPRLESPEEAVEALRLSAGDDDRERIVVLVCDEDRRIVLALDFADAPVVGAPQVMELLVTAVAPTSPSSVVIGLFGDDPEPFVVDEVDDICFAAGIQLLDVLVIRGDQWHSALD